MQYVFAFTEIHNKLNLFPKIAKSMQTQNHIVKLTNESNSLVQPWQDLFPVVIFHRYPVKMSRWDLLRGRACLADIQHVVDAVHSQAVGIEDILL